MLMRVPDTVGKTDAPRDRGARQARPPTVPQAAARMLALQRTAGNRAVGSLVRVQRQFDEAFVAQKAKEQKALEQWNVAASGRSQGLIHVIDYAKARPPKKVEEVPPDAKDKRWVEFMAGHPLSGAQLAKTFGKEPSEAATIAWLTRFTKQLEPFSAPKNFDGEIAAREKTISDTIRGATDKKAANTSAPVQSLRREIAELKSQLALASRWVVGRDDSKKGRVEKVAEAMEKKKGGQRPNYAGNEILGVTGALNELVNAENTKEKPARGFGQQITAENQWVKKAEGTKDTRAQWKQEDTTFEGSAYEEESAPAGLRVVKWGPKGETKYSTVMGGSG